MRKIFYLSVFVLSIITTSCTKEEIVVTASGETPEWANEGKSLSGSDDEGTVDDTIDGTVDGGGITDPNDDPDGKTKPKKP